MAEPISEEVTAFSIDGSGSKDNYTHTHTHTRKVQPV